MQADDSDLDDDFPSTIYESPRSVHNRKSAESKVLVNDDDISAEVEELTKLGIFSDDENVYKHKDGDVDDVTDDVAAEYQNVTAIRYNLCNECIPSFHKNGLPSNWTGGQHTNTMFNLVELHDGDEEHDAILKDFTNVGVPVKKVERLENRHVLDKFKAEMDHMQKHRSSNFQLKARYLYHGTPVDKETICEEGLDQRLSSNGFFGKGIYFSDNPVKCVKYTQDISTQTSESYILKCRVLLGESKVYEKGKHDRQLKREPKKENPSDSWKYYDSVIGCPKDYNEFVVYDNRRAMIEYVITVEPGVKVKDRMDSATKMKTQVNQESSPWFEEKSFQSKSHKELINTDDYLDEEADGFEEFYMEDKTYVRSQEDRKLKEAKKTDLTDKEYWDRLQDVREAVRKKRNTDFGCNYSPPTETQKESDKEVFTKLHTIHSGKTVRSKMESMEDDFTVSDFHYDIDTQQNSTEEVSDTVGQALDVCIIDFLTVTDTEDVQLARYYISKADNMDVNHAISLYYEDSA